MPKYDLEKGAGHARYEVDMFRATLRVLVQMNWAIPVGGTEQVERYAYLEAFLLHYRNLLDFLAPRPSARATDIQAQHYLDRDADFAAPVEYRAHLDQRLAHLTAARIKAKEDPDDLGRWPFGEMAQQIGDAWDRFLGVLEVERPDRRGWFGPKLQLGPDPDALRAMGETSSVDSHTTYFEPSEEDR